jgi:hypothetical protein
MTSVPDLTWNSQNGFELETCGFPGKGDFSVSRTGILCNLGPGRALTALQSSNGLLPIIALGSSSQPSARAYNGEMPDLTWNSHNGFKIKPCGFRGKGTVLHVQDMHSVQSGPRTGTYSPPGLD